MSTVPDSRGYSTVFFFLNRGILHPTTVSRSHSVKLLECLIPKHMLVKLPFMVKVHDFYSFEWLSTFVHIKWNTLSYDSDRKIHQYNYCFKYLHNSWVIEGTVVFSILKKILLRFFQKTCSGDSPQQMVVSSAFVIIVLMVMIMTIIAAAADCGRSCRWGHDEEEETCLWVCPC